MLARPLTAQLQSKSIKQSIISGIARDFNLTPVLAEAYFSQISDYFVHHAEVQLGAVQCYYLEVEENEPAGKPLALCKKVSVKLEANTTPIECETHHAERQGRSYFETRQEPSGEFIPYPSRFMVIASRFTVLSACSNYRGLGITAGINPEWRCPTHDRVLRMRIHTAIEFGSREHVPQGPIPELTPTTRAAVNTATVTAIPAAETRLTLTSAIALSGRNP